MDIESLESFLLACIAVPNQSQSPKKARLMPQTVMVTTVPGHPDASAEKIMIPQVSLIGASQGRQYKGEWALLTRHSADYFSDVHPHPLTFARIVWKRIRLNQTGVERPNDPFTDSISLYRSTQQHAVQHKVVMVSTLPKCVHLSGRFEFRSELGFMSEFKNDAITLRVFCTPDEPYVVEEFTPRSILFSISFFFYFSKTQEIADYDLIGWIRMIDQIMKMFGVIDSFYTDELILQPKGLADPNTIHEDISNLKRVVSDRIEKFEAVLDLIILPLQRNLELAGLVAPEASVLFDAQHTLTRLKAGVESTDSAQLLDLLPIKFKDHFPQESGFWFKLLQKLGVSFWKQILSEVGSKTPEHTGHLVRTQVVQVTEDTELKTLFEFIPDMSNLGLCQFLWQQRGAVHTISDAVKHQQLESMQQAYKKFKFIRKFRPPAYTSCLGYHATPLGKMKLDTNKSETHGLLPQPLFRRGSYQFTKVNAAQSSANYIYMMLQTQNQPQNLLVVKPGCYLDLVRNREEIFYKIVFIDRATAADFDLGRRATPNGLGNPTVVGGLDIDQLRSTGKLAEFTAYQFDVFCAEFSKKWIFMLLLADDQEFCLVRISTCEDGPAACTLNLFRTLQSSSDPVELTGLRQFYAGRFESSRSFPLCYLESKNTLLMAQPFNKQSAEQLDNPVPLQICLMAIDCTQDGMKIASHKVFDSGCTIDSVSYDFRNNPIGLNSLYKPEWGFYFRWQMIEGRIFGVWLKNPGEYTVYALHKGRFTQTYSGKLRVGLSPTMKKFREILPNSHGAYWLPFAIAQRTTYQPGKNMSLELQTFQLKLI